MGRYGGHDGVLGGTGNEGEIKLIAEGVQCDTRQIVAVYISVIRTQAINPLCN